MVNIGAVIPPYFLLYFVDDKEYKQKNWQGKPLVFICAYELRIYQGLKKPDRPTNIYIYGMTANMILEMNYFRNLSKKPDVNTSLIVLNRCYQHNLNIPTYLDLLTYLTY